MRGRIFGNGGGASPFGVIEVYYPEGTACTCYCYSDAARTHLALTLRADANTSRWLFFVPMACYCTIHGTGTAPIADRYTSITEKNQIETIYLVYRKVLLSGIDECVDETGGWTATAEVHASNFAGAIGLAPTKARRDTYISISLISPDRTKDYYGGIITSQNIDFTHYNKLLYEFSEPIEANTYGSTSIQISQAKTGSTILQTIRTGEEIGSINVSGLTSGKYYIAIRLTTNSRTGSDSFRDAAIKYIALE